MKCPFCDLSVADRAILNNEHAYALLSNPRLVRGHALVIPHRHLEYPGELTDAELVDCFGLIEDLRAKMLKSGLAQGVDVRQNYRPFLPESRVKVNHVHFHVLPRKGEDELHQQSMRFEKDLFTDLSDDERREISTVLGKGDSN